MHFNHERDQQRLSQRAGGIKRKQAQLDRLYEFVPNPDFKPFLEKIFTIKEWLLTPRSLCTFDFTGFIRSFCNLLKKKQPIDPAMDLLLDLIDDVPSEHCQSVIGKHEHNLLAG